MNTKSLLTRIGVPVARLGLLGGIGAALATSASASTLPAATMASATHATTVRGITFQGHVEDTTDHATSVTDPVYGPVWSYDDMSRSLAATRDATDSGLWHVTLSSTGVYHAFADPRQDNVAYHGSGLMAGWVTYDVRSVTAPSQAHLPLTVPSTMHSTDIIAKWFGNPDGFDGHHSSLRLQLLRAARRRLQPAGLTARKTTTEPDGRTVRHCHARGKAPSGAWLDATRVP